VRAEVVEVRAEVVEVRADPDVCNWCCASVDSAGIWVSALATHRSSALAAGSGVVSSRPPTAVCQRPARRKPRRSPEVRQLPASPGQVSHSSRPRLSGPCQAPPTLPGRRGARTRRGARRGGALPAPSGSQGPDGGNRDASASLSGLSGHCWAKERGSVPVARVGSASGV
jgi:hypothetical protein